MKFGKILERAINNADILPHGLVYVTGQYPRSPSGTYTITSYGREDFLFPPISAKAESLDFDNKHKCQHCGQWGTRRTACSHCGAPID